MPPKKPTALGQTSVELTEASSDHVLEEIQQIPQSAIIAQLKAVTDTLTNMQQVQTNMQQAQNLLMEAMLALQKTPSQAETNTPPPNGSESGIPTNQTPGNDQDPPLGEVRANMEVPAQKDASVGMGSAAITQLVANPSPITIEQIRALIQSEKNPSMSIPDVDLRPPYPSTITNLPYPEGYAVPKFVRFDGRKGNAKEHVTRFVDSLGIHSGDRNLRLREFSKSLTDKAYSWYTNLQAGSVLSWEDMVRKFYSKFFYVEERLTTLQLMRVTQKPYEDLNVYVRRFRELSVDLQDPVSEDNLTKMCVEGMQPAFKPHLVTHNFSDFSALYEAARSLSETVDPPVRERPPQPPRYQSSSWKPIPRRAERESKRAVYAASGPSHRGRQEQFKRPKFNEPPPLPVTPVEAQAFLNAWVQDGKVVLPNVIREPSQRDMSHPDYCIFHRMVRHSTKDCWGLRSLFQKFVTDNSIELPVCKDVLRNPLPTHKDNGKAVMMVTHGRWQPSRGGSAMMISHHDELEEVAACDVATLSIEEPDKTSFEDRRARTLQHSTKFKWLFDQFGLGEETRFEATKAILRVAEEHGEQCMGLSGSVRKLVRDTSLPITFTEADRQLQFPHNRPLYVPVFINGVEFQRGFMDGGASLNILPYSTFKAAGIPANHLMKQPITISGFGNHSQQTMGFVQVDLIVGQIRSAAKFHVIDSETSYQALLGRTWMHRYAAVPSTYHQCMKAIYQNRLVTIIGSQKPFKPDESHMADAIFYDDVNEEESPVPPRGIPIPKWSDISREASPSTSDGSNKKRMKDDTGVASVDTNPLKVTKYVRPDGKEVYRL